MYRIFTMNRPMAMVLWLSTALLLSACSDSQQTAGKSDSTKSDRQASKAISSAAKKPAPPPRAAEEKETVAALKKGKVELTFDKRGYVTAASFRNAEASEESLKHLAKLKMLRNLRLDGHDPSGADGDEQFKVADEHLEWIQPLTQLKKLHLGVSLVTDKGLALLTAFTNLEYLYLNKSQITSSGMKHLTKLTRLRTLDLKNTSVTDEGLDFLKNMPSLENIILYGTYVSDDGVEALQNALSDDVYIGWQYESDEPGDEPSCLSSMS